MRFSKPDINSLSHRWRDTIGNIVDQHTTVDVRSLRLHSPLPQQFAFLRLAFKQDPDHIADSFFILAVRNLCLLFHQAVAAPGSSACWNFVSQVESRSTLFV